MSHECSWIIIKTNKIGGFLFNFLSLSHRITFFFSLGVCVCVFAFVLLCDFSYDFYPNIHLVGILIFIVVLSFDMSIRLCPSLSSTLYLHCSPFFCFECVLFRSSLKVSFFFFLLALFIISWPKPLACFQEFHVLNKNS